MIWKLFFSYQSPPFFSLRGLNEQALMSNPPKGSAHKQESGSSTMATGEKTTRAGSESSGHHWAGYSCSAGEASSPRLPLRHRPPPRDFRRYIIFGCPYRHPKKVKFYPNIISECHLFPSSHPMSALQRFPVINFSPALHTLEKRIVERLSFY